MLVDSLQEEYRSLLSHLDWHAVLEKLNLQPKSRGDHFLITCPKCREQEGFFYPNPSSGEPRLMCNRKNRCSYSEHILALLNNGSFPEGQAWADCVQRLADMGGASIDLKTMRPEPSKPKPLLTSYWDFLRSRFPGSPAETYVSSRGLNLGSGLYGYFPCNTGELLTWAHRSGYSEEDLVSHGLLPIGENGKYPFAYGRLAGAFIDQSGEIRNLWGRDLSGKTEVQKYLNLRSGAVVTKKIPYGADSARGGKVVWVEGYLDAIVLRECEIPAVASGTSSIPENSLKALRGLSEVIVSLDQDRAGIEGTVRFIEKNVNNENLAIFCINPALMSDCKDIAELHQKHGKEAVRKLFEKPALKHPFTTIAGHLLSQSKQGADWTPSAKSDVLQKASAFDAKVASPSKRLFLQEYFWKEIGKELSLHEKELHFYMEELEKRKSQETNPKNEEKRLDPLFGLISRESIVSYYKTLPEGIDFGLRMNDEPIRLPCGGYTAVAAPTKHGKTTVIVNMAYSALERDAELEVVFVTLEELSAPIVTRFINRHVEQRLSANNFRALINFYKNLGSQKELTYFDKSVDLATFHKNEQDFYKRFFETGRLRIIDLSYEDGRISLIEVLRLKIQEIKYSFPKVRLLIVDYLQLLNVTNPGSKSRDEVLKNVCLVLKDMAAQTGIAIVTPVQFNRTVTAEDDLHPSAIGEAGSIERQCSLLFGMWNRRFPQFEGKKRLDKPVEDKIALQILLNRYGPSQQKVILPYDGNLGKIDFKNMEKGEAVWKGKKT